MNKLPIEKRVQIINMLCEGMSMRGVSRTADISINTVTKLLVEVGYACECFHRQTVTGLRTERIQADEIWSFVYAKQKNVEDLPSNIQDNAGDVWTWTAIDADTKLIISWEVGQRDSITAFDFIRDLTSRLIRRVQLTTDGLKKYVEAVDATFLGMIDFAQSIKQHGYPEGNANERRYSPVECIGAEKKVIYGKPDEKHNSTSYVERQNLTMRMHNRRFTRLTNAFSKKIANHCFAIALHFVYYNFVKNHKTLRMTPAMASGLADSFMSMEEIVKLTEIYPYKK